MGCNEAKLIFLGSLKMSWTDLPYAYVLSAPPRVNRLPRGKPNGFASFLLKSKDRTEKGVIAIPSPVDPLGAILDSKM